MLKGLEISVLNLSEVKNSIEDFRIHSEFFKKEFLENEIKLKSFNSLPLSTYSKISDGDHSKFPDNQKREVRYLQARDINNNFLEFTSDVFISKSYLEKNKRSLLKGEDILISIMGTVGDITILPKGFQPAMCNRALAIVKNIKGISPQFLFIYLTTKFAFIEIERLKNGGVQQRLNLDVLSKIRIPKLDSDFQEQIEIIVLQAQETRANSKSIYKKAENILLDELGLKDFNPKKEAVNIKLFSESFAITERIDSEFYQKKYDVIEQAFDKFKRTKLNQLIKYPISSGVTPKAGGNSYTDSKNGIPFVRAVDLKDGEVITSNFKYIKNKVHNSVLKRTQLEKGDVLLSIAGTVGRSSIFDHDFEANINQAVSIIRFDEILIKRLYLVAFFNSKIGKEYVSKYSRQGVQTNLSLVEVGNLSIPIIDFNKQKKIACMIEESFDLKKQSEHLLEVAKKAVEIAIEENEENALEYIKSETNE